MTYLVIKFCVLHIQETAACNILTFWALLRKWTFAPMWLSNWVDGPLAIILMDVGSILV